MSNNTTINWKEELKDISKNAYCPDCGLGSETSVVEYVEELLEKLLNEAWSELCLEDDPAGLEERYQYLRAKWLGRDV